MIRIDKHYNETDSSDVAIAGIRLQKLQDGKIHTVRFVSRTFNPAEINSNVDDNRILPVACSLRVDHHYPEGAKHKTTIFSDHQNVDYSKMALLLNRRQARWSEELMLLNFQ